MAKTIGIEIRGAQARWADLLALNIDLQPASVRDEAGTFAVGAQIDEDDVARLQQAGFEVRVTRPDLEQEWAAAPPQFAEPASFEDEDVRPLDERAPYKFLPVSTIQSHLLWLEKTYRGTATLWTLPNKTAGQRPTYLLRLRSAKGPAQRPGVFVVGGVHARELVTPDIVLNFATYLAQCYSQNKGISFGGKVYSEAWVKAILENVDVFVLPLANPDGRQYQMDNVRTSWRKNRNTRHGGEAKGGVDINRNFPFLWSENLGASPVATDNTYKGPQAASEAETQNVIGVFNTHANIRYFVDVHSMGEKILYSWGDDTNQSRDPKMNFRSTSSQHIAHRGKPSENYKEYIPAADETSAKTLASWMAEAIRQVGSTTYTPVQSALSYNKFYPTSGASDDYAFSRHLDPKVNGAKIWAFTLETYHGGPTGGEYAPKPEEAVAVILDGCAALMELCCAAYRKSFLGTLDADAVSTPLPSSVEPEDVGASPLIPV